MILMTLESRKFPKTMLLLKYWRDRHRRPPRRRLPVPLQTHPEYQDQASETEKLILAQPCWWTKPDSRTLQQRRRPRLWDDADGNRRLVLWQLGVCRWGR